MCSETATELQCLPQPDPNPGAEPTGVLATVLFVTHWDPHLTVIVTTSSREAWPDLLLRFVVPQVLAASPEDQQAWSVCEELTGCPLG
jgi:hypothetical protein